MVKGVSKEEAALQLRGRRWVRELGGDVGVNGLASATFLTAASSSEARSSMARFSSPPFVKCRGAILISDKGGTIGN